MNIRRVLYLRQAMIWAALDKSLAKESPKHDALALLELERRAVEIKVPEPAQYDYRVNPRAGKGKGREPRKKTNAAKIRRDAKKGRRRR